MKYVRCRLTQEEVNHYCNCFVLLSDHPTSSKIYNRRGKLKFFKRRPQSYTVLPSYGTGNVVANDTDGFKVPTLDSPVLSIKKVYATQQNLLEATPAAPTKKKNTPQPKTRGQKMEHDKIKLVDISLLIKTPSTTSDDENTNSSPVTKKTNGVVKAPPTPVIMRRPSGRIIKPNLKLVDFVDPEDRKPLVESPKSKPKIVKAVPIKRKAPSTPETSAPRKRGRPSLKELELRRAEEKKALEEDGKETQTFDENSSDSESDFDESLVVRSFLPSSSNAKDLDVTDDGSSFGEDECAISDIDADVVNGFKSITSTRKAGKKDKFVYKPKSSEKRTRSKIFASRNQPVIIATDPLLSKVTSTRKSIASSKAAKLRNILPKDSHLRMGGTASSNLLVLTSNKSQNRAAFKKRMRLQDLSSEKKKQVTKNILPPLAPLRTTLSPRLTTGGIKGEGYSFSKLVKELKSVVLPAPNWRIRIVVSKEQSISEITFTNKQAVERCVKFTKVSITHKILFGTKTIVLLGAPNKIQTADDVSILLSIVDKISEDDPVIECVE